MFQELSKLKIGLLVSGGLGNTVLRFCSNLFHPTFIATDSKSDDIIQYSIEKGMNLFTGNPRKGKLNEFLKNDKLDVVLSINYLFIIEKDVIEKARYAINFHGSLLPRYRGRTPHVWAIINNEKYTGVTAHIIDENCDTGPIVKQVKINILPEMTGANILDSFNKLYPQMVKEVLEDLINGNLKVTEQDITKATYFPKRSPEDGRINWEWQWERILNWVRAQADPYPGAFTFLNGKKVIIDKVQYTEFGHNYNLPNGQIIGFENKSPIVKVSNGALILREVRAMQIDFFKLKDVLK